MGGSDEGGESVCVWAVKEGSERDIEREGERVVKKKKTRLEFGGGAGRLRVHEMKSAPWSSLVFQLPRGCYGCSCAQFQFVVMAKGKNKSQQSSSPPPLVFSLSLSLHVYLFLCQIFKKCCVISLAWRIIRLID